ncbi:hypothetical protein AWH62_03155 [Maricaulis sp. W15]|nr:hypothetical protein AWH62_03155 [Maricaulis sp. W15]
MGGQDGIVSVESASSTDAGNTEIIVDRNHINITHVRNFSDLAYLILKNSLIQMRIQPSDDIVALRAALTECNEAATLTILQNVGRLYPEKERSSVFMNLLILVQETFGATSTCGLWAQYLLLLDHLFHERKSKHPLFSQEILDQANKVGMGILFHAEQVEVYRKNGDQERAAETANALLPMILSTRSPASGAEAYYLATAHFLIANLLRDGGDYNSAVEQLELAVKYYRPSIISHQVELAHCVYALNICRIVNQMPTQQTDYSQIDPSLRRFSHALFSLNLSHEAWLRGDYSEAVQEAQRARTEFLGIGFGSYSDRANRIRNLIEAWRRLELGATVGELTEFLGDYEPIVRQLIEQGSQMDQVYDWLQSTRPSRVIGILQFGSAFGDKWSFEARPFRLPPLIRMVGERVDWSQDSATSLSEADFKLRAHLKVKHPSRVPLLLH